MSAGRRSLLARRRPRPRFPRNRRARENRRVCNSVLWHTGPPLEPVGGSLRLPDQDDADAPARGAMARTRAWPPAPARGRRLSPRTVSQLLTGRVSSFETQRLGRGWALKMTDWSDVR